MNVMALITGLAGAVYGGIAVWLVALRRRRPWTAAGLIAVGSWLLITMATAGNRSRAEHKAVWLASCVLWAFFIVCVAMDARRRRIRN
jgi:threonine/homoserine efflux transporter RhtA